MPQVIQIPADDLDEASIFLYRIWTRAVLGEEPEALVLKEPEYVLIGTSWVLYCNRLAADEKQVALIGSDTGKKVICAAPKIGAQLEGLEITTGRYRGDESHRRIIEALARAANDLPPASKGRDPETGRWETRFHGQFELWGSRYLRLIFRDITGNEFGYTWERGNTEPYMYKSRSCKKEGKKLLSGFFKLAEQKRGAGKSYWNIDLLDDSQKQAALLRLTPAGAGYKVFTRQLPSSFLPIEFFYKD